MFFWCAGSEGSSETGPETSLRSSAISTKISQTGSFIAFKHFLLFLLYSTVVVPVYKQQLFNLVCVDYFWRFYFLKVVYRGCYRAYSGSEFVVAKTLVK